MAVTLHAAGYQIRVVNPVQAHTYAKSLSRRRTTDDLAALMLSQGAVERQPTGGPPGWRSTMRCASG